jgi:hypothetical protein
MTQTLIVAFFNGLSTPKWLNHVSIFAICIRCTVRAVHGVCHSGTVYIGTGLVNWMGGYPGRPEQKADYSPTSSAQFKKEWSYTTAPSIRFHSVQRYSFTLNVYLLV